MRRKAGSLVPLERSIGDAALALRQTGVEEFHGYRIAKQLAAAADARRLTAYGTLYRALGRLEKMGILESHWEDPEIPARENRPGRRLYRLTAAGERAIADAHAADQTPARRAKSKEGLAPGSQGRNE